MGWHVVHRSLHGQIRWLALLGLLPLLAGCSTGHDSSTPGGLSIQAARDSRANGAPIALVPVNVPKAYRRDVPKGLHVFSLTYWSRGLRCQAYLDVPSGRGSRPLWVLLHGGYVWGMPSHYSGFPLDTPSFAAVASEPDICAERARARDEGVIRHRLGPFTPRTGLRSDNTGALGLPSPCLLRRHDRHGARLRGR